MGKPPKPAGSRFGQFCCQKFLDPCKLRITLFVALVHNLVPDHWTARHSRLNRERSVFLKEVHFDVVGYTAVFSVVTHRSSPLVSGEECCVTTIKTAV